MLKMFKNKKAQNTAEYAILIALVVGGVIAMQTYAQRALQGRLRDASVKMRDETNAIGTSLQYEPYYSKSVASKDKDTAKIETASGATDTTLTTTQKSDYVEQTTYNADAVATTGLTVPAGM
jgi:hypothetical protein